MVRRERKEEERSEKRIKGENKNNEIDGFR